jgi:cell wall-associated NlpC family hydrolase
VSAVEALAAPLRQLVAAFGTGDVTAAGLDTAIGALRGRLQEVAGRTQAVNVTVGHGWTGSEAESAQTAIGTGGVSAREFSLHTGKLGDTVTVAAEVVAQGRTKMREILDSFLRKARAADPVTDPATLIALLKLATEHLQQALDVLGRTREQLGTQTAKVTDLAAGTPTTPGRVDGGGAATVPTSADGAAASGSGSGSTVPASSPSGGASGTGGAGSGGGSSGGGLGSALGSLGSTLGKTASAVPVSFGGAGRQGGPGAGSGAGAGGEVPVGKVGTSATITGGVEVTLPDGRVVKAPNAAAAAAVQAALTQIGVPYSWGGTSPGVGLDCSGLTQWAYRQGGIDIPRLAQEQNVGTAVNANELLPGDLVVWSGHVAMVVGAGLMVEAGDPVQVNPVRTDNIGQQFYGFFRPTG